MSEKRATFRGKFDNLAAVDGATIHGWTIRREHGGPALYYEGDRVVQVPGIVAEPAWLAGTVTTVGAFLRVLCTQVDPESLGPTDEVIGVVDGAAMHLLKQVQGEDSWKPVFTINPKQ